MYWACDIFENKFNSSFSFTSTSLFKDFFYLSLKHLEWKYRPNNAVGWRFVHLCVIYPVFWVLCHDNSVHLFSFFHPRSEPSFWKLDRSGPWIIIKTLSLSSQDFICNAVIVSFFFCLTFWQQCAAQSLMILMCDSNSHFVGHTWDEMSLFIYNVICKKLVWNMVDWLFSGIVCALSQQKVQSQIKTFTLLRIHLL